MNKIPEQNIEHCHDNFEKINKTLCNVLYRDYKHQWDKVFSQKECDIGPEFLGFVSTYYYLAKLIPRDWTVIDFGCAYAPQAYYFKDHNAYVGVDGGNHVNFRFANSIIHKNCRISDYLNAMPDIVTTKIFAICNYVPSQETELVRKKFPNCYIFYPQR